MTIKGSFQRVDSQFRSHVITDDDAPFAPEAGRYMLYVSLACPWAHRTLIMRKLKRLEQAVDISVANYHMGQSGWNFTDGLGPLSTLYHKVDANYTGRFTVPVLWDKKTETIVNNESIEIMRMFDTQFDAIGDASVTFYPEAKRDEIDKTIRKIYSPINNGVYRAGFARSQQAYDQAVNELFDALDHWDAHLGTHRYLCGDAITEADWCMFTTLVRFDVVYHGHFKCNRRRIVDYKHLSGYLRELYQIPGIADTCDFEHIRGHYYTSHESINPTGIIAIGPDVGTLAAPHHRDLQ